MTDLSKIQAWVAKPYDKPSKILESSFQDPADEKKYLAELGPYLPSPNLNYLVIQRLMLDDSGGVYVFQEGEGNWDKSILAAMGSLKLRLVGSQADGFKLVDEQVEYDYEKFPIGTGWKITHWEVQPIQSDVNGELICDVVTWEKGEEKTVTLYGWKLY